MGEIVEDIEVAAEWISSALSSSGYTADFSLSSIHEIERFFSEHSNDGVAVPGGLLSEDVGSRLFAIGAYVGEVIRKSKGGEWVGDNTDPNAEINVHLDLNDNTRCWPIQRVMKRFKNGSEDSVVAYAIGLGVELPPAVAREQKKPWWKIW